MRLVICLYEQAIEDVRRAVIAMEKGHIEVRTHNINHALAVIAQLQGSLDMERGGEVAKNLHRFYNVVRGGLVEAQLKQSARILEQQISHLVLVYESWMEAERLAQAPQPQPAGPAEAAQAMTPLAIPMGNWKA
jgi:flagellar secretion chaperone FliS